MRHPYQYCLGSARLRCLPHFPAHPHHKRDRISRRSWSGPSTRTLPWGTPERGVSITATSCRSKLITARTCSSSNLLGHRSACIGRGNVTNFNNDNASNGFAKPSRSEPLQAWPNQAKAPPNMRVASMLSVETLQPRSIDISYLEVAPDSGLVWRHWCGLLLITVVLPAHRVYPPMASYAPRTRQPLY